ncbi:MAG TPA: MgtC/SapB family protein [Terriglobales bacterium]|nr:MgtC/SapB family protein [Terriglobales bacterium]
MSTFHDIVGMLRSEMSTVVRLSMARLILAAILGGVIGLERELKHRAAGLRTNMFICLGSAMFTILSDQLAGEQTGDHTRVAAQIIAGIGFIGAGSILHGRGELVTGLTTAATLFIVASIGMAVGGGLYLTAIFATALVVVVLLVLGGMERQLNLKLLLYTYEVTGQQTDEITTEVNRLLEKIHALMRNVQVAPTREHVRVQFDLAGTRKQQEEALRSLRQSSLLRTVASLGPVETE